MSDVYLKLVSTLPGRTAARTLGLPAPVPLQRLQRSNQPFVEGNVVLAAAPGARATDALTRILAASPARLFFATGADSLADLTSISDKARPLDMGSGPTTPFRALVFDATGIRSPEQLRALYDLFHPGIRQLEPHGRVLLLGLDPVHCRKPAQASAQQALEGFCRSLARETGRKAVTANLIRLRPGAAAWLESAVRFLLSSRSAYVSGQVITVGKGVDLPRVNPVTPLTGKVALVTGASRGIGEAIARVLARDGATVIGVDIPASRAALDRVTRAIDGHSLVCDITSPEAPATLAGYAQQHFGALDLVIHNAGITRDRTLGKMPEPFWDAVIDVNLAAQQRIDAELLEQELIRSHGRIVCLSSISGIAGNFGQSNYATAKAGVIGYVQALARHLPDGITINAVAPGFIETAMTEAMPLALREAGRRMNSLCQGGQPVDVAEAVAWFCNPASGGVNGNVLRVCGQSLIGK